MWLLLKHQIWKQGPVPYRARWAAAELSAGPGGTSRHRPGHILGPFARPAQPLQMPSPRPLSCPCLQGGHRFCAGCSDRPSGSLPRPTMASAPSPARQD